MKKIIFILVVASAAFYMAADAASKAPRVMSAHHAALAAI